MGISDFTSKVIGDKRRWRQYKARTRQLPANYHTAIEALERYLMYFGSITNGDLMATMLEDLADLFEQSAADGTPIRAIVGDDPVEFAEAFLQELLRRPVDQQGAGTAHQDHRSRRQRRRVTQERHLI